MGKVCKSVDISKLKLITLFPVVSNSQITLYYFNEILYRLWQNGWDDFVYLFKSDDRIRRWPQRRPPICRSCTFCKETWSRRRGMLSMPEPLTLTMQLLLSTLATAVTRKEISKKQRKCFRQDSPPPKKIILENSK